MNIGRLIITIVVVAIVMFVFDGLYHGGLLKDAYEETKDSWLSEEQSKARFPIQIVCTFVIAAGFCTIWAFGFGGQGIKCGAIYGFFIGLTKVGGMLITFVYAPIPDRFMVPWAIGGILSFVLAGIVTALVYKPKAGSPAESSD